MSDPPKEPPTWEQMTPEQKRQAKKNLYFVLFVMSVVLLFAFGMCERSCSSLSTHDDRWERLEHNVKTDPYYKQW